MGDGTGIVCVPIEVAQEVMEIAQEMERQDEQAMEEIRNGLSFAEALGKFKKL